jgi:hypothetical protein
MDESIENVAKAGFGFSDELQSAVDQNRPADSILKLIANDSIS